MFLKFGMSKKFMEWRKVESKIWNWEGVGGKNIFDAGVWIVKGDIVLLLAK